MTTLKSAIRDQIAAVIRESKSGQFADIRPALSLDDLQEVIDRAPEHDGVKGDLEAMAKHTRRRNRDYRGNNPVGPLQMRGHLERIADPLTIQVDGLTIETANDKDVLSTIHARLSKFRAPRKPTKREKRLHAALKNERLRVAMLATVQGEERRAYRAAA